MWIDYLTSPDAPYPDWLKYFAFRSVVGMGEYDKEKKEFTKRSKGTTKPFPDLNQEALSYVLDAIEKKYTGSQNASTVQDPQFAKYLVGNNFPKLYGWAIERAETTEGSLETIEGAWTMYPQGSDHLPLVESLQGYGTGWCTAGESTARKTALRWRLSRVLLNEWRKEKTSCCDPYGSMPQEAGTVNTGTQYQLTYYATTANAVSGDSSITTNAANQLLVIMGAAGTPSYSFSGDPDTGIFYGTANRIDFAVGGTNIAQLNSSGFTTEAQSSAAFLAQSSVAGDILGVFSNT